MSGFTPEEVMEKVASGRPYILMHLLPGRPLDVDEDTAGKLQMGHLSYLFALEQEGKSSIFGPVIGNDNFRGLIIFNTNSREDVSNWMKDDPYIKAGYLTYELHDLFTLPGQQVKNY
jgi:uncharacterized protein